MAKRELIDRKALIDNGLSKGFCEWYDEIKQAEVITEQEIVKPYLEKIRAEIEQSAFNDVNGSKFISVMRVNQIIDKCKAESEDE